MKREKLSDRIKLLRVSSNLSQEALGNAVGFSKQAINDLEHGRRSTTADKLIIIADFFDVSIDYLLGRSDDPKRY